MNRPRWMGLTIMFVILLLLHFWLRPLLAWRAGVDFLAIGVLLVAVRVRPGIAALVGCLAGVIADSMMPAAFGTATLSMTMIACAASWLKATFFAENIALNAIFVFGGKLALDLVFLVLERRLSAGALLSQVAIWSSASALVTALVGVAVLVLFRPFIDTRDTA